jgi:hypothetical protein
MASIDRFLTLIRQEKSWSYNFSFAIAPDTNINTGTSGRQMMLFGLPFELGDDTRKRSGTGIAVDLGAEFAPRISESARFRIGGTMQRREYSGKDFDDMTAALYGGPRLVLGKWDLSATGLAFQRKYGGRLLSKGLGTRLEATYHADMRTAITGGVSVHRIRYPDHPLQDGGGYSLWGNATRALTPESFVTARIGWSHTNAEAAELAYRSRSISVGYYRDLASGFSIYAEPSISELRYDAADSFFGERRRDKLMELRVGLLNRRIEIQGFTPRVAVTFGRRQSTIDLYDYSQRRIEAGVTRSF